MEVTGEVQALTFDWYLTVGADGNRKAGHEVHTVGITATSTSRQVHGTVIQSLQLSGSQEITNFNNNHVKATEQQLPSRHRVIPNYNYNRVSPSTAINVTPEANVTTVRQQTPEGHVVVEVHPNNTTPSFFQKILEKGIGCKDLQLKPHEQPQTLAPTAKDLYTYPWDKSSLKSMPINLQDFQMLDAYASVVGSKSSVEDLVRALLRKAYSDLEKVRAIWIWICHHIEYDMEELRDKNRRSADPEHILRTRKGVCAGYAGLFERMCRTAGIRCVQLTGFAKGFTYEIGQTFSGESNHAWNAVYLAGSWHLVDSTWGAGFVNNTSNRFTFQYNEFYFLTHPALFADGHFPDNQNWQLLKPPLSLKQFENNIRCTSSFYTAGLVAANPETVIIETGDCAYAVRTYMMTPYLNPATPVERRYNSAHRATRNVVERTFGLLKSRFRCIHKSGGALLYSPDTTCRIVATCAILHNIATTRGIPVEISEPDSDEDDDPIPPLQPADRTSAAEDRQRRADITHNHFSCAAL